MARSKASNQFVWTYLRPEWPALAATVAMAAILGLVTAGVTTLVGPCLQVVTADRHELQSLVQLLGPRLGGLVSAVAGRDAVMAGELLAALPPMLGALAVIKAGLGLGQWFLWERTTEVVARAIRQDLVDAYLRLDPDARRQASLRDREADLSSAVTTDVRLFREYLVHFYGGLPRELLQLSFLAVTLVMLSPKLTLVFALGVAPAAGILDSVGRKLRRRAAKALADSSILTEWLQQRLLGIETIKHYGTESTETVAMEQLSGRLYERFIRASRVKARTSPLLELAAILAMVVALAVALRDIAGGQASGAMELSFFSTLALISQAASRLGRYLNSNREGVAATSRLEVLHAALTKAARPSCGLGPEAVQVIPAEDLARGRGRIHCERLSAHYPEALRPALGGVTATFVGGRLYALVGPSGAGKSTWFQVLLGLVTPSAGRVTWSLVAGDPALASGGQPLLAYMPQKVQLMPGTLAANISYPEVEADGDRVSDAIRRVGLEAAVAALPQGVSTLVGEGGHGLSGGQAQRLLLARLWYHQSPFVLVDEGTSALDPELEQLVVALLRELANRGSVVITIAHRLALAEAADEVLVLAASRLVESGSPAAVLASPLFKLHVEGAAAD